MSGSSIDWRPGASLAMLELAALHRQRIRRYFDSSGALEVVTPVLSRAGATEPAIEPFDTRTTAVDGHRWLQTSPEFSMKRLVAAYGRDVWQLAPVFRRAERGARHNTEFQLLEWYRVGADLEALMSDVAALLTAVAGDSVAFAARPARLRYGECVRTVAGDWPERLTVAAIADVFVQADRHFPASIGEQEHDAALDLLFDTLVVPTLPDDRPAFVTGYPPSQASLARLTVDPHGRDVAARFELYANGVELANGFHELLDADEQLDRFEQDLVVRTARAQVLPPIDEAFIASLRSGLPECSGVALGLDRLTMVASGARSLDDVMAFADVRA